MAAKIPIRTVYTGANATGLSEYQSGDYIAHTYGGTGLVALGTANQVLATNSGASAMEWQTLSGDIAGVTAGTGLSGGGTSGTVTLSINTAVTVDLSTSQTLTNKTLTTPIITSISNSGTITVPSGNDTLVARATTDTLTNKSIDLGTNTITGSLAEFNSALQSESFVSLTGSETLTNKTLTSPVLNGTLSGTGFLDEDNMASNSAVAAASQQSIKTYVDATASGLDLKDSSHAATAAALSAVTYSNGSSGVGATLTANANGALTVDGQTMVAAERVLVKDQAAALQNGIYTVTATGGAGAVFVLTRTTDFDSTTEITSGAFTFVETGTTNADSGWVLTTDGAVTVGTTALAFSQFSGAGQITAGTGLSKSGNTLSVDVTTIATRNFSTAMAAALG